MNLYNLLFLQVCVFVMHAIGDENASCFKNGSSPECTLLILSRQNITLNDFENKRSRIKLLIDSDKLRITAHDISAFDMAMGCYAIGQRLPSERGCVSCLNCKQQMSAEVCDLFCPLSPVKLSITPRPDIIEPTLDEPLHTRGKSLGDWKHFLSDPLKVIIMVILLLLLLLLICIVVPGFIYFRLKQHFINQLNRTLLFILTCIIHFY